MEEDDDDDNFRTAEEVAEYGEGENAVAEPRSRRVERGAVAMILIFSVLVFSAAALTFAAGWIRSSER